MRTDEHGIDPLNVKDIQRGMVIYTPGGGSTYLVLLVEITPGYVRFKIMNIRKKVRWFTFTDDTTLFAHFEEAATNGK